MQAELYVGKHMARPLPYRKLGAKHYEIRPFDETMINVRANVRKMLLTELVCVVAAGYGIYLSSAHNNLMRDSAETGSYIITSAESADFPKVTAKIHKETQERIIEELDEIVWTKVNIDYRTGPDESYKVAGAVDKDRGISRTGVTKNAWSRISLDDEEGTEYYVKSSDVTTESPIASIIEVGVKGEYQMYAYSLFPDFGWGTSEMQPLINLWNRESRWNTSAHNRSSGAHGIPQALPGSKMASEGSDWATNYKPQIRWGLKYIKGRYGSPSNAWAHFQRNNWY